MTLNQATSQRIEVADKLTARLENLIREIQGEVYLPAEVQHVFWGRLPCAADAPVLTVSPGTTVTIDTISHEGVREDQGKDPLGCFRRHGVPAESLLSYAATVMLFSLPSFILFLVVERRVKDPLMDLSLFRHRNLASGALVNLFVGFCLMIGLVIVPILVNVRETSVVEVVPAVTELRLGW